MKDYPYLYETHLHTKQGSACAWNTGYEMAKACHEAGYAGIIVTDHNWGGNTAVDRSFPWEQWVDTFCQGYEDAKRYAELHDDFTVFFGYEAGFCGTEFLIYGITPEWLKAHPEIRTESIEEHHRLVHEGGGTVIHAHPFREEWYIPEIRLFPDLVDGVEGVNASHYTAARNKKIYDDRAMAYANKHGLPMTAGSDVHSVNLLGGGMAFRRRLTSVEDFCEALQNREDYRLTNGDAILDSRGHRIE